MSIYEDNFKKFNGDKNKAIMSTWMRGHIRHLFESLFTDFVTSDMKITINIDSKYYEFNHTESIQGEKYQNQTMQEGKCKQCNENAILSVDSLCPKCVRLQVKEYPRLSNSEDDPLVKIRRNAIELLKKLGG